MSPRVATPLPSDVELRRTGLGGTDVARVLGVSRFGGPMSVSMEKRGLSAPLIETTRMKWGKLLEDPIAREYASRSGRKVRRAAAFLRHPEHEWAFANIDRWSELGGTRRRVLEVKTADVFSAADFGDQDTDQVPPDYLIQGQWYLWVAGLDTADFAALIGGNREWYGTMERDDALLNEQIVPAAEEFWRNHQQGIWPEIDGSDASAEYLRLTYRDKGAERPMDDELIELAHQYESARLSVKTYEEEKALYGNRIRDLLGDASFAVGKGVKVTNSEVRGATRTDWPALVEAQGIPASVVEEFTGRGPSTRQLRVVVKPE